MYPIWNQRYEIIKYKYFFNAGVVAIFDPGTSVAAAGKKILEVLLAAHEE